MNENKIIAIIGMYSSSILATLFHNPIMIGIMIIKSFIWLCVYAYFSAK